MLDFQILDVIVLRQFKLKRKVPLGTTSIVEKPTKFKMSAVGTAFIFFGQLIFLKRLDEKTKNIDVVPTALWKIIVVILYNRGRA